MTVVSNIGRVLGNVGKRQIFNTKTTTWSTTGNFVRVCPTNWLAKNQIMRVTNMTPPNKKAISVPNIPLPRPQQKQFMPPINVMMPVNDAKKVGLIDWIKENSGAIILNFGSICLLVAFTRKDIVELRALAMTGSLTNVIYFATRRPINYLPMTWSSVFVMTNLSMLYFILDERNGSVSLSENQLKLYEEHFLPHGVTPKQFEKVLRKATKLVLEIVISDLKKDIMSLRKIRQKLST